MFVNNFIDYVDGELIIQTLFFMRNT